MWQFKIFYIRSNCIYCLFGYLHRHQFLQVDVILLVYVGDTPFSYIQLAFICHAVPHKSLFVYMETKIEINTRTRTHSTQTTQAKSKQENSNVSFWIWRVDIKKESNTTQPKEANAIKKHNPANAKYRVRKFWIFNIMHIL